jgi:hypothetical protein
MEPECSNPRHADNLGTMLCAHRRYTLGDEQLAEIDTRIECPRCDGIGDDPDRYEIRAYDVSGWKVLAAGTLGAMEAVTDDPDRIGPASCGQCGGSGEVELAVDDYLRRERGATVILPLGLHDHSGISMYVGTSRGWDSGQVGVIFDTAEARQRIGLTKRDDVERSLRGEVEEYDSYLRGEVYGYVVDPDGVADSCWGFVGDDLVMEQANAAAEDVAARIAAEAVESAAMAARGIVTVGA